MMKSTKPSMSTEQRRKRVSELNVGIRKAALSLDPQGKIAVLAQKAGLSYNSILTSIARGYFSAGSASAIELAVGRDIITKEDLAPHVYEKAEA